MNKVEEATRIRSILSLRGLPAFRRAACKDSDPELFFPPTLADAAVAKIICEQCRERITCLNWALRDTQIFGIWGGTTDVERRELRHLQRTGNDHQ